MIRKWAMQEKALPAIKQHFCPLRGQKQKD